MIKRIFNKLSFLLIGIILLALVLRLYQLENIPSGIHRDEAALGYSAYSMMLTGQDEYGKVPFFSLQSFGDQKLPLYSWLLVPIVKLFSLSIFSTRLLSVLAGTISVYLVFFIGKKLFSPKIGFVSAFLFCVMPWSVYFSRAAYEANVALTLFLLGLSLLLVKSKKSHLFSALMFSLTLLTYHSSYFFIPIFLYLFLIVVKLRDELVKTQIISTSIFTLFWILMILVNFQSNGTKVSGINITSNPSTVHADVELPRNVHTGNKSILTIIHNRYEIYATQIFESYINFFTPQFLVEQGGINLQHNMPDKGNLSFVEYLLLFSGALLLIVKKPKYWALLLGWFFLAPLIGSFTRESPHYARSLFGAPVISLIGGYALTCLLSISNKFRSLLNIGVTGIFTFIILIFLDNYFVHFPLYNSESWNYGLSTSVKTAVGIKDNYLAIVTTEKSVFPYIYFLFFNKYSPSQYKNNVIRNKQDREGFVSVQSFDKYFFSDKINWGQLVEDAKILPIEDTYRILIIDQVKNIPASLIDDMESGRLEKIHKKSLKIIKTINHYSDKLPVYFLVEVRLGNTSDWKSYIK